MHLAHYRILLLPHHLQLHLLTTGRSYATTTTTANFADSQSANKFPYPNHSRPSAYEIFHLPVGASQKDVKSRYYDLVRLYHPDSPFNRTSDLSKQSKDERFRSITNAYDLLRGKRPDARASGWHSSSDMDWSLRDEIERRRKANNYGSAYARYERGYTSWSHPYGYHGYGYGYRGDYDWNASSEQSLRDKVIICVGILCIAVAMAPSTMWSHQNYIDQRHLAASANLARARREAREFGAERRAEVKKRVQANEEGKKSDSDT